ncbi:GAF domain-containing protein [Pedobacter changchengzhani]|uniref:GAF domain-containing protein n=1 Tax=Pedobacter changchengzhani TaxID=2529274 RepID=A0A4R5MJV0_9SPHI|nr:GAF domain-containing protein [Pedobacter changchengzhani]TDG35881.1 GAF domain-containing protein [Pedobacter changchengzhani]
MNTKVIRLNDKESVHCQIDSSLSFRPLVAHLKGRLKTEQSLKSEFYRFLLDKIEREDELLVSNINPEELTAYSDTLELIFTILTPLMANSEDLYWALSTPIPDKIFFSTDTFYNFFQDRNPKSKINKKEESLDRQQLRFIYRIILERFYKFSSVLKNEIIYAHSHPETNLTQYYNIHTDTQFVDIKYVGSLPEINYEKLGYHFQEGDELEFLEKTLPLNNFSFEGFTVISLSDITVEHALLGIRNVLVDHNYQKETFNQISQALKTIGGNSKIDFGLMPFLTVNGKLVFDNQEFSDSKLINATREFALAEDVFFAQVDAYKENPRSIFVKRITEDLALKDPFLKVLKQAGISSYSVLPVFNNNELAGIMEVYSKSEYAVDDNLRSKLQPAMPLIGQFFQYSIDEFGTKMDAILKDKFTALQPSVQWKFNEAVWRYIKNNRNKRKTREIETVSFKNMYPLFGAIDIKDSTVERNLALKEDLQLQLNKLLETLKKIKSLVHLELTDKILFDCNEWLTRINSLTSTNEENLLIEFLETQVYPFLLLIKTSHPSKTKVVDLYFESIEKERGLSFKNRRKLEVSMQMINSEINQFLEQAQANLQASYPCYFGKFRTDGVEYDIYIGQELAPDKSFDTLYLKNIRLWQLTSMVEIARITKGLVNEMPRPLLTTQLIFIHSNAIDISFRNDERRFDVEGAYNIRYEVVKKRIDKVLIKNTAERLTQPDKIAMVYFNADEAKEYADYIKFLQDQDLLNDDLEFLELDELQGVAGLKAIRVGVKYVSGND